MDEIEDAQEHIERAHHAHIHEGDSAARWIALMIAGLAAALAIAGLAEKSAQTAYVNHNITLSDSWAFYQAKNMRAAILAAEANVLESLPNAADPQVKARIAAARQEEARLRDDPKGGAGIKQLAERARQQQEVRDEALHRNHQYEIVVGALQLAILVASVSLLMQARLLTLAAGALGAAAIVYGLVV
jgi:hypothetical protein